ncbi:Rieske (2Fe-2S) protein [Corallococcus sp. H22C18031201]|uniref:QcrA and Rieske domain-containing protein n=1 Tax=Citreicoccus inhibens TaxID=2849499 RepID=UPI000E76585E|nr:Rieske (2Fe-2S) protein [Citreicoccus inhibens]MBU8897325.1 Rieske (2Fe-2S) protein [Citreicoccus inhibens]RJS21115.1 Rieske (2Fe-2S) protein [Corallococcus sp. H22C18031201]
MSTSRRGFLKGVLGTGAVAGAAAAALPGCAPDIDPAPVLDVPAPGDDGKVSLVVPRYPDLSRDGGAVTLRIPGMENLLLVHPGGETFAVMSATCTHVGCPLGFNGQEAVCPCHLSRFGTDGRVTHPPAKVGLKTFPAQYNAATQVVTIDLKAGDVGFPSVVNGKVALTFAQFPQLQTSGGVAQGKPQGYGNTLFVFRLDDGSFSAVDGMCTHQGCTVTFDSGANDLLCPCHSSTFTKEGAVTQGPATVPLKKFTVTSDASGVTVTVA